MKRFTKQITEIIIHCTATKAGRNLSVSDIEAWHRERGFEAIGYHFIIDLEGNVAKGRDEACEGAHCLGHNDRSIGVAYVGGLDDLGHPSDTRTSAQRLALQTLVNRMKLRYPGVTVHGHNEFANKSCPCFDVKSEFK